MDKAKRIRDVVEANKKYLKLLEEKDRTGKLRKPSYKERVNFTIDKELMIKFRNYCRKNDIAMSRKVETLIREFLGKTQK